jgi:hypothetical protein
MQSSKLARNWTDFRTEKRKTEERVPKADCVIYLSCVITDTDQKQGEGRGRQQQRVMIGEQFTNSRVHNCKAWPIERHAHTKEDNSIVRLLTSPSTKMSYKRLEWLITWKVIRNCPVDQQLLFRPPLAAPKTCATWWHRSRIRCRDLKMCQNLAGITWKLTI